MNPYDWAKDPEATAPGPDLGALAAELDHAYELTDRLTAYIFARGLAMDYRSWRKRNP